jgi:uncharacterized protein YdcH (DUF465 family)
MENQRHLEVILEDMNSKFDLVLEGHESLRSEIRELSRKTDARFDLVDFKIDTLNQKIDGVEEKLTKKIDGVEQKLTNKIDGVAADLKATDERLCKKIDGVAADLKAHRADTEAHSGMYQVRES